MAKDKKPDPGSPFSALRDLRQKLALEDKERAEREKRERLEREKRQAELRDESDLFAEAMAGVRPIERGAPKPRKKAGPPALNEPTEEQEVMLELAAMVEGRAPLDFTDSDEFVEGRAEDCSRLNLMKLRNGELAVQARLDLHGHNREEAREALREFFAKSITAGHRCVLVICGRGLNSPGGKPVLKELLVRWLVAGSLSHPVLAFSSAKAHDGGVGALYVLLRKNHKRPD